jgi:DNA (cytosine-5)-methyltransferase 1
MGQSARPLRNEEKERHLVGNRQFTVLSLFSGGMGLDLGLEQTGRFRLLACAEKVPVFCDTIRRNRDAGRIGDGKAKVYEGPGRPE